jgi:hypothetical protein
MIIQTLEKDTNVRLYYKSNNTASGLDVVFNLWDFDSNPILTNAPAAGEIGTKGLYHINFTTPNTDTYLVGTGEVLGGKLSEKKPIVLKVGVPEQQLFFVDAEYATGRTVPYQIYTIAGAVADSGNLSELVSGFYYTGVDALSEDLTYLFEANNKLAESFTLEEILTYYYEATGGFILAGDADTSFYSYPRFEYEGDGGFILGGAADAYFYSYPRFEYEGTGGFVLGGSADSGRIFVYEATGGFELKGSAQGAVHNCFVLPIESTYDLSAPLVQRMKLAIARLEKLYSSTPTTGEEGEYPDTVSTKETGYDLDRISLRLKRLQQLANNPQPKVGGYYHEQQQFASDTQLLYSKAVERLNRIKGISATTGEGGKYSIQETQTTDRRSLLEKAAKRLETLRNQIVTPSPSPSQFEKSNSFNVLNLSIARREALERVLKLEQMATNQGESGEYAESAVTASANVAANLAEAINRIEMLNSIEKQGSCI